MLSPLSADDRFASNEKLRRSRAVAAGVQVGWFRRSTRRRLGHFVMDMLKNGCSYEYPVQSVGTVGTLVLVSVMSGVHTDVSINASDSARIPLRSTLRG
jgi:hypothetical protein